MKYLFPRQLAFLFATFLLAAGTATRKAPSPGASAKSISLPAGRPPVSKALTLKRTRRLSQPPSVSALSVPSQSPPTKTRIFTPEELIQRVENYGHQAWETANELRELIAAAEKGPDKKQGKAKAELTLEEELKVKQAISFVREANTSLKYYIDHFILTEEVLEKYEQFIESHADQASSTNGVLKFMVHEFRDIHLRKFEREFFEKVKMYNSVIKDKFTPLFFLPLVNKSVHTLQIKLLNGERLIIFIKKYMAFVMRIRRGFHLLDYEKGNRLFQEPDVDPHVDRFRVVSNEQYEKIRRATPKKSYVPVTIVVGNDGFGAKPAPKKKLPSDYIENKEELKLGGHSSGQGDSATITNIQVESHQSTQVEVANGFGTDLPQAEGHSQGMLVSMSVPAKKLLQDDSASGAANKIAAKKYVNPLDQERDAFIRQKMAEVEQKYSHRPQTLKNAQTIVEPLEAQDQSHKTIIPEEVQGTAEHATIISEEEHQQNTAIPTEKSDGPKKPLSLKQGENRLVETGSQSLVELDRDGLPINLEIQRVPEVIRMDERYEDPFVVGGKAQTGLTAKVAEIEGKRVDADFLAQKAKVVPEPEIPQKRVIYHPNQVNGGLPQPKRRGNIDEELGQIDEVIKDNGAIDKAKLRKVDALLGLSRARSLWDEDLGAVYSKLTGRGLI